MEPKISIIYIRNPFDPASRDFTVVDYQRGASLADYMQPLVPAEEYAVSLNGGKVALELRPATFPEPGDQVVVCPVVEGGDSGKNILRMVAIIVVTIVAALVGQYYVGPMLASAMGVAGTMTGSLVVGATAALMGIGASMLMNALLPPPKVALGGGSLSEDSASATYSWNGPITMAQQGVAIPVVYGTHRVGGNVISQKITSDGTNQYLDLLIDLCEGVITSVDSVLVNNNPIENFGTAVAIDTRLGTLDQTVIGLFGDLYSEIYLNMKCVDPNVWARQSTVGDGVQGLEVDLTWATGLFTISGTSTVAASVTVDIQWKIASAPETDWMSFDGYPYTVAANSRDPYRISARVDGLAPEQYTVRVRRCSAPTGPMSVTDFYWTALREIIYDDMAYPGVALLGIRALATNNLSGGAPNVTCLVHRTWVAVNDGANWLALDASNPAWVAYDILVNSQYGGRIPYSRVDYPSFKRWADFCDELVPTFDGSTEKRITFNGVFDTSMSMWDAVNVVAQVGRGAVILRGTRYYAYFDAPGTPTQMFSVANIVPDSFKEVYLPIKDRATELEVQYADAENNYERSALNVMTDEGFAGTGVQQKTTIAMMGCTRTTQAYREARYRLLMNQLLIRTVSFDVGIDSLACEVGDLIYVQHDVPSWGLGGRVLTATINTVTLDQDITLEDGKSYRMMIRYTNDMLVQRTVSVPGGGYNGPVLTLTENLPTIPSMYDMYIFGEVDKDRKVFRLIAIRRAKDFDFTLTALEYNDAVYATQIAPETPEPRPDLEPPPFATDIVASCQWIPETPPYSAFNNYPASPYESGGGTTPGDSIDGSRSPGGPDSGYNGTDGPGTGSR